MLNSVFHFKIIYISKISTSLFHIIWLAQLSLIISKYSFKTDWNTREVRFLTITTRVDESEKKRFDYQKLENRKYSRQREKKAKYGGYKLMMLTSSRSTGNGKCDAGVRIHIGRTKETFKMLKNVLKNGNILYKQIKECEIAIWYSISDCWRLENLPTDDRKTTGSINIVPQNDAKNSFHW